MRVKWRVAFSHRLATLGLPVFESVQDGFTKRRTLTGTRQTHTLNGTRGAEACSMTESATIILMEPSQATASALEAPRCLLAAAMRVSSAAMYVHTPSSNPSQNPAPAATDHGVGSRSASSRSRRLWLWQRSSAREDGGKRRRRRDWRCASATHGCVCDRAPPSNLSALRDSSPTQGTPAVLRHAANALTARDATAAQRP